MNTVRDQPMDALAEIAAGVLNRRGGRIVTNYDRLNISPATAIVVKDYTQGKRPEDRDLERTDMVPGSDHGGRVGTRFRQGAQSPIWAGQIQSGDIIAVRQERQSAYNSYRMGTTVHSKQYEVVSVGEDAVGIYFKLTQPGRTTKGKGGRRWLPQELDSVHGIIRAAGGNQSSRGVTRR